MHSPKALFTAACALFGAALLTFQAAGATAGGAYLARMSPGFLRDINTLPLNQSYSAFVRFNSGTPEEHRALLSSLGLKAAYDFEKYAQAQFAMGPVSAFRELATRASVFYLEDNYKLQYFADTATWATRARVAQEPVSGGPYTAADGKILRGQGVTVAVVDSGLDALHPDFAGRVLHNYKVICPTADVNTDICPVPAVFVDMGQTNTDTTGGHGTHVTGIAAGSGAASTGDYPVADAAPNVKGTYTGVAPDASIIHYGTGETLAIFYANEAFQHLLDNYDSFSPRVRVVSNSYGAIGGGAYDPNSVQSALTKALVEKGAVVVFAAGNGDTLGNGGDGSADLTSPTCKDPTPGVICVANYDDGQSGSRTGSLDSSSSRGKQGDPASYPDIAAPGAGITATCLQPQPGQAVCASGLETNWQPYYGTISGTSMATPHVAGAVALIAQARPELTPEQIERLMQNTARKVASNGGYEPDPQNPGGTVNFGFGAGLLDIPAALDALNTAHPGLPASGAEITIFDGDNDPFIAGAADAVKLTMQESAAGVTPTGITYRLTLRDAADFQTATNGLTYQLQQNVDGKHFVISVKATAAAVTPAGAGGAVSASRDGNVVSFFVPYSQLGSPPVGAPIHNIAVAVYDPNNSQTPLDLAPSPANSTGATAAKQPMFGKSFTVLLEAGPGTETPCVKPGLTILTDKDDDIFDGIAPSQGNSPFYDIQKLSLSEPSGTDGSYKLAFHLKMKDLSTLPEGSSWPVSFCSPAFPACSDPNAALSDTNKYFTVRMTTLQSDKLNPGNFDPEFQILQPTANGTTQTKIAAEAESNFEANGLITIVVKASDLGLSPANAGLDKLTKFLVRIRAGRITPDNMPDSLSASGEFQTVGPTFCASKTQTVSVGGVTPAVASPAQAQNRFGGALSLSLLLPLAGIALRRSRSK